MDDAPNRPAGCSEIGGLGCGLVFVLVFTVGGVLAVAQTQTQDDPLWSILGVAIAMIVVGARVVLAMQFERIIRSWRDGAPAASTGEPDAGEPPSRAARDATPAGLRFDVFQRDGFRCRYCGRSSQEPGVTLHADHVIPASKGGPTTMDNLVTACQECNLGKSAKDVV